jgi:hypothetical protein
MSWPKQRHVVEMNSPSPERRSEMFVVAIGLYSLSSFVILLMEFKKMVLVSRIFLLIQFAALFMMVIAWLGISF